MCWQNRSSGRRYVSSSGHSLIIGERSKGIIGIVLYSKAFRKCDAAEKKGEEVEEHEFPKNFEGSSKIIEASAILKMVEDALYNFFFIIHVIVSNNGSTMRAVLKHPLIGVRGKVMKSSEGKIDEGTSHCVKLVAKHIFSMVR